MKRDKWAQLAQLSDLIFDVEAQKFARLQEEEAKLKQKRDRLEEMNAAALNAFNQGHLSLRMGGDFYWQTWVGNNASRLGQAQARARALSEIHKPALRKAFGRKNVLKNLIGK
ncbi:hypothetical protein [Planktotalea sp.]|uniref:hypothetical protein n=1 Tax=Planktotalea sp. TaxID=2029877 RepID=UPI003F6C42D6